MPDESQLGAVNARLDLDRVSDDIDRLNERFSMSLERIRELSHRLFGDDGSPDKSAEPSITPPGKVAYINDGLSRLEEKVGHLAVEIDELSRL